MERVNPIERLKDIEKDTEVTSRILGALGLVNAFDYIEDTPPVTEHPEDDKWIVRSGN